MIECSVIEHFHCTDKVLKITDVPVGAFDLGNLTVWVYVQMTKSTNENNCLRMFSK
ncbi:hypothetical protein [Sutcliffiella rhizosphaerae]|uniref:Uncharacterized protein n=1 Tax=Sutcliffiella rhizosphaerae TaxID=2880967 RepID=A0ABM8YH63_9BACI|nr:hypothetical protein [Sutcliffiella rhizosphaerae]CAG9619237.1 hypothetical protein BACCIP111883_00004 [Sutcliffiella rhizosphaerae]